MKQVYLFLVSCLLILTGYSSWAQQCATRPVGAMMSNAIDIGSINSCGKNYSDANRNNDPANCYGNFYGQASDEIYYKFTLLQQSPISITTCGINTTTYSYLLNSTGGQMATGGCGGIQQTLSAGTYFIVVENIGSLAWGSSSQPYGSIYLSLQVTATTPVPPGATLASAIDLNTLTCGSSVSNVQNNNPDNCFGNNYGQASDDIYYKFTLPTDADVNLSHCGSGFDTYLHLLNSNGSLIASNDDNGPLCSGTASSLQSTLAAGTYYIVSEGYGNSSGTITTTISASITTKPTVTLTASTTSVEAGASVTLSASGACSYEWVTAPGLTATSGAVVNASPPATTTYTVIGRAANGLASDPVSVTISVTQNLNYIYTTTVLAAGADGATDVQSLSTSQKQEQVTYFDGLGRATQQISVRASPLGKDLVVPITYDAMGRPAVQYLPYAGGTQGLGDNGLFQANALERQLAFYADNGQLDRVANDVAPYARTEYEASPLGRVLKQGAPGQAWQPGRGQDHTRKFAERGNRANEVRRLDVSNDAVTSPGYYAAGELWVKEQWNEHDALTADYTDKSGQVVLKRVAQASSTICEVKGYYDGGDLVLTAPAGMRITGIQSATFGSSGSGAPGNCETFRFGSCQADVTDLVQEHVRSQLSASPRTLSVRINVDYLGDPCAGQSKFLQVVATYEPTGADAALRTYYAYDELHRLRLVIPPAGVEELDANGSWGNLTSNPAGFQNKWCFQYAYDGRGRLTQKTVPGGGKTWLVYDQRDQVVMSQDANQYEQAQWSVNKYDALGRPVIKALYYSAQTPQTLQQEFDASSVTVFAEERDNSSVGYTLTKTFPSLSESQLLSILYYDNYLASALTAPRYAYSGSAEQAGGMIGSSTGSKTRQLDGANATSGPWLTTAMYYDRDLRLSQLVADNTVGGLDRTTNTYNFVGSLLTSTLQHTGYGATHTVATTYRYDKMGRLLETTQNTDNQGSVLLARQEYNEIGQLIDKKLHSSNGAINDAPNPAASFLQSVDYRYNIRGWLTKINDRDLSNGTNVEGEVADPDDLTKSEPDLFGMDLNYDTPHHLGGGIAQYNGNITEVMWRTNNPTNPALQYALRGYNYSYDQMNRLKAATYKAYEWNGSGYSWANATSSPTTHKTDYSVTGNTSDGLGNAVAGIDYDANGNIRSLHRKGVVSAPTVSTLTIGNLDQFTYYYSPTNGNQLLAVDDAVRSTAATHDFEDNGNLYGGVSGNGQAEYAYDSNGNLIKDVNKGIHRIGYNHLNLVTKVEFGRNNVPDGNRIEYTYSASGTKLQKRTYTANTLTATTDYAGAFIYENAQPAFLQTSEGRALYLPTYGQPRQTYRWKYEYHLKDHLGNLRFAFRDKDGGSGSETQLTAGLEPANAEREEQDFDHVADTRMLDVEHARTGNYVARLSAKEGRRQGPSITLTVAAGDSVTAEVYGRYDHTAPAGQLLRSGALVSGAAVSGSAGGVATDKAGVGPVRRRALPFVGASIALVPQLLRPRRATLPTAFLRYELYDQDSQLVATHTRPLQRTATDEWQHLSAGLKADSAGYVRVSVVNESDVPAYFDDLVLKSADPIYFQENHYDPWGQNLVGIESAGTPNARFQYNGKEKQEDFGLGWLDYGARMYNAQLGRWNGVDIMSDSYSNISTYTYALNNPIMYIDIDGNEIGIKDPSSKKVYIYEAGKKAPEKAPDFVKQAWNSINSSYYSGDNLAKSVINDLTNTRTDYSVVIEETKLIGATSYTYHSLDFNSIEGLIIASPISGRQSPASGLYHELFHAYQHMLLEIAYDRAVASGNKEEIVEADKKLRNFERNKDTTKRDAEYEQPATEAEDRVTGATGGTKRGRYENYIGGYRTKNALTTQPGVEPSEKEVNNMTPVRRAFFEVYRF